jgi:hypothetical protein
LHIHAQPVPDDTLKLTQLLFGVITCSANQLLDSLAKISDAKPTNSATTKEYDFIV